jgi:hypothetical protein
MPPCYSLPAPEPAPTPRSRGTAGRRGTAREAADILARNSLRQQKRLMASDLTYIPALNRGLSIFFSEFVCVRLRRPSQAAFFARTVWWQGRAARRRAREARGGLHVPPIAIFSITNRCS